jgi:purine-binding chemotaxis protein CheW
VPANDELSLIFRVGTRRCAVPAAAVAEVVRMLPIEPVANAPAFVMGVCVIRGETVPVVDAALLVGATSEPPTRLVVVTAGDRRVALAVVACEGLLRLGPAVLRGVPPLLREAAGDVVSALGLLDGEFLEALDTARILPDDALAAIDAGVAA